MKKIVATLYIVLFIAAAVAAQGIGSPLPGHPRGILPQRLVSNEPFEVGYRPGSATEKCSVILYVYDTLYHWHVYEQTLTKRDDTSWTTTVQLPVQAGLVAYLFREGDMRDNNEDKGYLSMVFRKDGRYMPGAEAGYGLLRSPRYGMGVPDYFRDFSISDTATYMWLSNEILRNRGGAPALVLPYLKASSIFKPATTTAEAIRAANFLLHMPAGGETILLKAWLVITRYVKDSVRADSIRYALVTKYPGGGIDRLDAYNKAIKARTIAERFAAAKAFIARFPYTDANAETDQLLGISDYSVYRNACSIAIAEKKDGIVAEYKDHLPLENIAELYYKAVEIPYDDWKSMTAETALPLSTTLYQRMLYYCDHQPSHLWYYPPSEWNAWCEKTFAHYFRLHARILMETGHTVEALALARRAQAFYQYKSSDLNQTEAILLSRSGHRQEMDSVLRAGVKINQASGTMIAMLKEEYSGTHGGEQGFDAWFESLKDAHTLDLMREEIGRERLDIPAPDFQLTDANGRLVSLRSLRGKTVVLDFWATWCAPCKAAMAGMNMAVKKYKKDTSVVFYFVDTQEATEGYKTKAKGFLKEKGYDFNILFDGGAKLDTAYTMYANAIHTSGIPFKIVIDPRGVLTFANVGYKGSPSGLADEIGMMIQSAAAGVKDATYMSEDIFYDNTKDSIRIGATLTYPSNGRARKGVVLISGTGAQDRDGTMVGHKLFALLADSLTRRGFAVIRSDDRGVGKTNGQYENATTIDFANDALTAVRYLRGRKDLGLTTIGLLGHSEGGMAAAIAAGKDSGVGFVISLSSPGTTGLEALLIQNRTLVHSAQIPEINKVRFDSVNRLLFTLVYDHIGAADLEARLRTAYAGWQRWDDSLVKANQLEFGGHFFFPFETYVHQAKGPRYQGFISYDAAKVLAKVKVPYLAINGDRDQISDGAVNLRGIADALASAGNHQVKTWLAPGLNHLYQHCHTCDISEYASLPETMAPEAVTVIGDWMERL